MEKISKYDYSRMICEKRDADKIDEAISIAQKARINYPEENIFEKFLGDLYFQQKQYDAAGEAYIKFLSKIGEATQYIKHFANFIQRYINVVDSKTAQNYIQKIVESLETSYYTEPMMIYLCKIIAPYIQLDVIGLFEDDRYFTKVTSYMRRVEQSYQIYIVYSKVLTWPHTVRNKRIDKYIVSSMEKKAQYQDALQLIENVLQYDADQVAVRTLFRICRKLDDYTAAERYIQEHPEIKKSDSFNVLYELVFYFSKTGNISERNSALEKIEKCGNSSKPIMRTLYNFYLQFGMLDKAVEITTKISSLESINRKKRNTNVRSIEKNIERKQQEEEAALASIYAIRDIFEELEHSRKLISMSELLKGFSHELGQPITNIRYSIQLYQMKMDLGISTEDELRSMLEDVLSQTLRVKRLLSRFSPIVSEKDNSVEFSVGQEIVGVLEEFSARLAKEKIEWKVYDNIDFRLYGDRIKFDQIFYNLIGNSIYAIKEKGVNGRILVKIKEQSDCYIIIFEDNGVGIEEKYIDKIFEPFFTTKEHISDEGSGGEGLGLYIIWNIVRMFNGHIKVDKQFKQGARFIIEIPR